MSTLFYISGGVLVVAALVVAFLGIRREDFPGSPGVMRGVVGVVATLVVVTAVGAVGTAREEQAHRADEHAAEEAEEHEEEQFESEEPEAQAPRPQDEGAGGEQLFVDLGCAGCHSLAAVDEAVGETGPNLDQSLADADVEFIRRSIVDPDAEVAEGFPSGVMPAFGELSSDELDALVRFLQQSTQG